MLKLYDLSVNGNIGERFIPTRDNRIGWKLKSDRTGVFQKSFCVTVEGKSGTVYSTGRVESTQSIRFSLDCVLPGNADYTLTVTVTDNYGETATESLLISTAPDQLKGCFIKPENSITGWVPYLRRKFTLQKPVARAVLYVCGLGCGEYYLNGKKISEDLIDPPATNYEREVLYRAYDVREFLEEKNAFTALLGEGWYAQSKVWGPDYAYGDCTLLANLEIEYTDGTTDSVFTEESGDWKAKNSPIVLNNLYAGETYDARLETPDFALAEGSEAGWGSVVADTVPKGELKLCGMPAVRILREIPARSVSVQSGESDGAWIFDLGENFAGFCEFRLPYSVRGCQYVFRFAETVNPDGTLDYRSAGTFATQCLQQDIYISRGDAEGEVWRPRFTYHAFRYVEVSGLYYYNNYGQKPEPSVAVGYQISTDLRRDGEFFCDNEDINRLQRVMMSTFRSNYHGWPEDCPGREKCGWLGDAQVVCNTGMMNYNMESSYEQYLRDIRTQTEVYGKWTMIAPGKRGCGEATPLWGCAQIIIPYYMYKYYGCRNAVTDNWDLMQKWVEHEKADAKDFIITRGLGDWCPPVGHESPRRIPVEESSTAMFYEICIRMAELCREFGYEGREYYDALAADIKKAFITKYFDEKLGRYSTWGTNGVALATGLYPEGGYDSLLEATIRQIREEDCAMSTGIYGNKYLIPVLCENGYADLAHEILFNRRHDSFGTMLDQGATSLWECVEMKMIGQPRESSTSSYNHPMHSGFAYYMYEQLAGIRPLKPGYAEFEIAPCPSSLKQIRARRVTPFGEIRVEIFRENEKAQIAFSVPANTVCLFRGERLTSGTYQFEV